MIRQDVHVHTIFSDGKCEPEAMVKAAIAKGIRTLGFSDHSYGPHCTDWCMPEDRIGAYRAEISRLKACYADRLRVLCGIEQDLYSTVSTSEYDYVIGSMHYIFADGQYYAVDDSPEQQTAAINTLFGGDPYAYAEAYYEQLAGIPDIPGVTIVGHFDLITKFNEKFHLFDPEHPRYVKAWQKAAEKLLSAGLPFEINTGAISRGWRTVPYPEPPILAWLKDRGAAFLLSSDCHRADNLAYRFDCWEHLLSGAKTFEL